MVVSRDCDCMDMKSGVIGHRQRTYHLLSDPDVETDRYGNAKNGETRPICFGELEHMLAIFAKAGPFLDVDVFAHAHSARHVFLFCGWLFLGSEAAPYAKVRVGDCGRQGGGWRWQCGLGM